MEKIGQHHFSRVAPLGLAAFSLLTAFVALSPNRSFDTIDSTPAVQLVTIRAPDFQPPKFYETLPPVPQIISPSYETAPRHADAEYADEASILGAQDDPD